MARLGLGSSRRRRVSPASPAILAPPVGFSLNGSTNARLKAMLARVRSGAGRGRIVWKGDSTTVGAGAGDDVTTAHLNGARANRTSAVLARLLTEAGYPALDGAVVGDGGVTGLTPLPLYDPRVALAGARPWTFQGGQNWAGGNIIVPDTGTFDFTPGVVVDTFEVVIYRAVQPALTFLIDGAPPAALFATAGASAAGNVVTVGDTAGGFVRVVAKAAGPGAHGLRMTAAAGGGAVRSIMAYDASVAAIHMLNHASNGAVSGEQAASGGGWSGLEALGFDAPDLVIVNLGLNDIATGVPAATYAVHLQSMIGNARASGDVLLVFPHPAGGPFANAAAHRDAAAALAANAGVAFLSLFDHFGGTFTPALQARMADGLVHGNAGFYAEVADLYRRCVLAMAA